MTHFQIWVQSPLAAAAGWALFHSLWEGAIAAAALATGLAMIRSAGTRYAVAWLAMIAMLVSFGITFVRSVPPQQISGATNASITLDRNIRAEGAGLPYAWTRRGLSYALPWVAPFWMAGVALFYLRHIASWLAAQRLRRTGVCCAADFWQQRLRQLSGRLRLSRPVALLESCLTRVPVVIGHVRPVILMPLGLLAGLPAGQIEAILLHELAHIRRYDYLVNVLQALAEGLLFYHPAVWWISGVIRTEREHCCDDLAVAVNGDAHQYAVALAALEQNRWPAPEAALAATGGSLVKRIHRLLYRAQRPSSALTPFFSAGMLMITAAVGLAAWQSKAPDPAAFAAQPATKPGATAPKLMAQAKQRPQGQAPRPATSPFTRWLEEEVPYIITDEERAAFLRLGTDEERVQFIEQFWLRRDPTPGTPQNEYRDEHYRRIAYANSRFAIIGTAGWQSDRGRIYIRFGPPDELETHPNGATGAPFPFERWLYRYIEGIGRDVNMEFVDRTGSGDYRMTSDPAGR